MTDASYPDPPRAGAGQAKQLVPEAIGQTIELSLSIIAHDAHERPSDAAARYGVAQLHVQDLGAHGPCDQKVPARHADACRKPTPDHHHTEGDGRRVASIRLTRVCKESVMACAPRAPRTSDSPERRIFRFERNSDDSVTSSEGTASTALVSRLTVCTNAVLLQLPP